MATTVSPPMLKRKTIIEDQIPATEAGHRGKRIPRQSIWDFLPTIPLEDWANARYQIYLYRWNPLTEKKMALEKFNEVIDPFSIKLKFGGGSFNVMMKDGPELIYNEDFEIEGEPITSGSRPSPSEPAATGDAVAIQAMRMMSNPDMMKGMFEMYAMAARQSMEMIRAQMPAPQDPLATLRNAKEILGGGSGSGEAGMLDTIRVLKELGVIGSPEKKGINEVLEMITTLKGAGLVSGGAPKPDWGSTLVANLPMLVDRAVSGLHEFTLQTQAQERIVRLQRGEMNPNDPKVVTIDAQPRGEQHNPNPAPPAAPTKVESLGPEVTSQIIMQADLQRLVSAMKQPDCTGEDIYTFLSCVWPEMLSEMAKFSKQELLIFFQSREMQMAKLGNAVLYEVGSDPRLPKMIEEFLAIAKKDSAPPNQVV
jgi:hypothetical protein